MMPLWLVLLVLLVVQVILVHPQGLFPFLGSQSLRRDERLLLLLKVWRELLSWRRSCISSVGEEGGGASMEASLLPHIIPTNTSQALFMNENNRIQNIEPTNISMSEVKTEPKESLFLSSPKVSNHRALVKRVCRKRNTTRRAAQWLSNKNAFAALKLIIGGTIKHKQTKKKKVQFQQSGNLKPWKPKVSKILKVPKR